MNETKAYYQITTSLKQDLYEKQKALREKLNPLTNKNYTLGDVIQAGVERLSES